MKLLYTFRKRLAVILIVIFCLISVAQADKTNWRAEEVDWLAGPGGVIKGIRFPKEKSTSIDTSNGFRLFSVEAFDTNTPDNVIESPPVEGFVPRIAINVTDRRASDDFDFTSVPRSSVVGNYLTNDPENNYIMGLFDTGASICIMSHAGAQRVGINSNWLTENTVQLGGATNTSFALVSMPLGIFMDGISAIDPNTGFLDDSNMVGESNFAIAVGDEPYEGSADLPDVIGSPVSVYYVTSIRNDNIVSVTYDGNNYTSPELKFYEQTDLDIPYYEKEITLNLKPVGAYEVQFTPSIDSILNLEPEPGSPSMIIGVSSQSLFFMSSVDLYQDIRNSVDKQGFMLDTGAQVTVISSSIAARLGLNPQEPDFEVEIQDATGNVTYEPGFYVDRIEIPALGELLTFNNVPVIMLDIASPEGGYLDGIIGMNLFTEFNLVLYGGGLLGQDPPILTYERIPPRLIGDIAPEGGDGIVNFLDYAVLAESWLATPTSENWNPKANLAPRFTPDSIIDVLDLAEMSKYWLNTLSP